MILAHGIHVLAIDGSRMLVLRNDGNATRPDLHVIAHRECLNPPNRDLVSGSPGLSFSAANPGRDTMEEGNPHKENEDHFIAEAAKALVRLSSETRSGLIVVAPPHALGELRRHYTRTVKARLIAEIGKDLTKNSAERIGEFLFAYEGAKG